MRPRIVLPCVVALTAAVTLVGLALVAVPPSGPDQAHAATVHRVLFDNSKAETAGNADWIISTSIPDPLAQKANPVAETDRTGALSAWGVALQRAGSYSLKRTVSYRRLRSAGFVTLPATAVLEAPMTSTASSSSLWRRPKMKT